MKNWAEIEKLFLHVY